MWWIKKPKKCPCPCHWRATGQLNPSTVHCDDCPKYQKEDKKRRMLKKSINRRRQIVEELDDIVSLVVRIKANWVCVKCHKRYAPHLSELTGLPAQKLMTASHYFSRKKYGTRWDFDNIDAMCLFCHQKVENNKKEWVEGFNYELFMLNKLGEKRFDLLQYRAGGGRFTTGELEVLLGEYRRKYKRFLEPKTAS